MIFKTEPYKHQLDSWDLAKDKEYWGHFHEMGAGKTKIIIDTANYLFDKMELDGVLVLAPNGVHKNWATKELPVHSSVKYGAYVWEGKPTSMKAKRSLNYFFNHWQEEHPERIPWMCMNIEAIRTKDGYYTAEKFLKQMCHGKGMVVIDESTIIKNIKAQQTKRAILLGGLATYRRILTGTPITQGPLDLFSQCRFLDKRAIPFTSFTAFRNTFAIEQQVVLNSGKRFNQIVGYRDTDKLKKLIEPFSDRILKKDCLDLPEKTYQSIPIPLHNEQAKLYNSMKDLCVAQLTEVENSTGIVTAQSVLSLLIKLQQITTGFLKDDEGNTHDIPNHRVEKLLQIIEEFNGKAIIWCAFRQNIFKVEEAIKAIYGPKSVVTYFGDTSSNGREQAIELFQNDPATRFFISNKTGAEGITLTAAEYSIYFSNTYNLHTRLQSEDRNHRIGQKANVLYTDFYSPGTVDERILESLKKKQNLADSVLTNWRELL